MSALLTHEGTQATTTEQATATETVSSAGRGPLRGPWQRIRVTVREMNDAARRVVELQAPWSVDRQWQSR
jgi:hypothetical protein